MNQILRFSQLAYRKQVNNRINLICNINKFFSVSQQSPQLINVTKMQLQQFGINKQTKQFNSTREYNDLEKYMIVKRKSILTMGRISELKGIEVQRILSQSSQNFMKDLEKYNPIDIINLLLLDHSAFKHNQKELVNYITLKLQNNSLNSKEYIYLVRSSMFCLNNKSCEQQLTMHINNILQKSSEFMKLSPYTACQLLIIYYQQIKKQYKLFDKENNFLIKSQQQQVKIEQQFRQQYMMENQIGSDKLLYEVIIENTLAMNYSNEQLLDLISELVYIGKFQRQDLLLKIFNALDLNQINLQQLIQLFINTTSKNVNVDDKIYNVFLQKVKNNIQINENQQKSQLQENQQKKANYSYIQSNQDVLKFIQGDEQNKSPTLLFQDEIEETNPPLNPQAKVDVLWILIRNYSNKNEELYESLFKSINQDIQQLQIRHLLSLLQCFIGYQMNKNIEYVYNENSNFKFNPSQNLIDLPLVVKMLISRMQMTKQPLSEKQNCSLYLNLIYLINTKQISQNYFKPSFLADLYSFYKKYAIANDNPSKTEDKFMAVFQKLQKENLIQDQIQRGVLIDDIYIVDFLIGEKTIIEVNGDIHHNQQTKSQIRQNFLQKLFYLKIQNYQVIIIDSNEYLPIINDSQKFEDLVTKILKNKQIISKV
ncbi:hypothetical protein TTHERM_00475340 (macronuclear) [Tetrahymena thermophila SB210]|uniref:DUF559 domain-containing protein n=1 Tax=Tetrahymena thermophila (strain SB210) TaxID=312017 RepID=I7MHZ6_TETTS|nr:hypothetical protein TTHERM_00475340 [Tetrahymena thermophila SB210]EAS03771.2 hypothetical protein TTHERM_00475340 [Tetrahymena thermophila SB210]|eukprot:XP_001024016.2 hypothetical protein TTHERM_00475340 [Tetrahymena thermophila SB210]